MVVKSEIRLHLFYLTNFKTLIYYWCTWDMPAMKDTAWGITPFSWFCACHISVLIIANSQNHHTTYKIPFVVWNYDKFSVIGMQFNNTAAKPS